MLRAETRGFEEPAVFQRPKRVHLFGRFRQSESWINFSLPKDLALHPGDDYELELLSVRHCAEADHPHFNYEEIKDGDLVSYPDGGASATSLYVADVEVVGDAPALAGQSLTRVLALDGGNDDDDDDDDDDEGQPAKRSKRSPRPKGDLLRTDVLFSFSKPPSRALEATPLNRISVSRLVVILNQRFESMFRNEYLGLTAGGAVTFYHLEPGHRVVLALPPLSTVQFGGGKLLWQLLGFQAPFPGEEGSLPESTFLQQALRGDYSVSNTSPFKTRLLVAPVSKKPNAPCLLGLDASQQELMESTLRVTLGRVRSSTTVDFDLTGLKLYEGTAAAPPPLFSVYALNAVLTTSLDAASFASTYPYADETEKAAGHVARDFQADLSAFPKLHVPKLNRLASNNRLSVTVSGGDSAIAKLGFQKALFPMVLDAGAGLTTTSPPVAFLRSVPSEEAADAYWDDNQDGDLAQTLAVSLHSLIMVAKDGSGQTDASESTAKGLFAKLRQLAEKKKNQQPGAYASLSAGLAQVGAAAQEDKDWEYASSDTSNVPRDRVPRTWQSQMTLDNKRRLVPITPPAWSAPVYKLEDLQVPAAPPEVLKPQQPGSLSTGAAPVEEEASRGGGGDPATVGHPTGTGAREEPAAAAAAAVAAEMPVTLTQASDQMAIAEQQRLETEARNKAAQETANADAAAAAATAAAAVAPPPVVVQPPFVQQLTQSVRIANSLATPQLASYRANSSTSAYFCPLDSGKNNGWPDPFHLICLEGEQKDWLGPRGKCSFLGTYDYKSGKAVTSQPVVLRGGGSLSGINLQILGKGYAEYVLPAQDGKGPEADALIILDAVLTPFRDSSLPNRRSGPRYF